MESSLHTIITQITDLVELRHVSSFSDEDFVADVRTINLLINLCDESGTDRVELRNRLGEMYPEFVRRLKASATIRQRVTLLRGLYDFIYGRSLEEDDRGPALWREFLKMQCRQVAMSWTPQSVDELPDYIWCACKGGAVAELPGAVDRLTAALPSINLPGLVRSVSVIHEVGFHIIDEVYRPIWREAAGTVIAMDPVGLDDDDYLRYCMITDSSDPGELRRRASRSPLMMAEWLASTVSLCAM